MCRFQEGRSVPGICQEEQESSVTGEDGRRCQLLLRMYHMGFPILPGNSATTTTTQGAG